MICEVIVTDYSDEDERLFCEECGDEVKNPADGVSVELLNGSIMVCPKCAGDLYEMRLEERWQ